jgi:uncharacterized membrane protein
MSEQSVVGVYDTMERAEEAVHRLHDGGVPIKHVSIVTQNLANEKQTHGFITTGEDLTVHGAVTGAWVGGLFTMLVGAAFLWIPGFGPLLVAGRLAALLLAGVEGALAGVAAGGLLGALANWGIAEEHILAYKNKLRGGKYLVIIYGNAEDTAQAHTILQGTKVRELHIHTGTRASGLNEAVGE